MSGTHFYPILPSNASLSTFANNTTTNYWMKLPWEVGLYSITYPHTWYNLQDQDSHIYYSDEGYLFLTLIVNYGYYEMINDLIKSMNKAFAKDTNGNITLTFNSRTEKVTVHLKNGYELAIAGKMSITLGFAGKEIKIVKTTVSPHVADFHGSMTIYVYCDIVQPQVIGDTNNKLLRSIPVEGKMSKVVTRTFTNIQYVPIQTTSFEDIEILLRDGTGNPMPFEHGKVLATLHFRRQNSPYFS